MRLPSRRLAALGIVAMVFAAMVIQQRRAFLAEKGRLILVIHELAKDGEVVRTAVEKRTQLRAEISYKLKELRNMGSVMPAGSDPAKALQELARLASAYGVTMNAGRVRRGWRTPDIRPETRDKEQPPVRRTSYEVARIRLSFNGSRDSLERFRTEIIAKPAVHPNCWWRSLASGPEEEVGVLMMATTTRMALVTIPAQTWLWPLTSQLRSLRKEISERSEALESHREILSEVAFFEDLKRRIEMTINALTAARPQTLSAGLASIPKNLREPVWLVAE